MARATGSRLDESFDAIQRDDIEAVHVHDDRIPGMRP